MAAISFLIAWLVLAMPAQAATYKAGGSACPPVQIHQPDADYQAGVDTNGWAVAPADLDAPRINPKQFESVGIELDIPASQFSDNAALSRHFPHAEIAIGELEINQQGAGKLNGEDITYRPLHPNCQ